MSGARRARRKAPAPMAPRSAQRWLVRDRSSRAVDPAREVATQDAREPLGDADEAVEVDSGVDPFATEQVDKILRGDVSRGARSEGAAAEAADRGLEDGRPGLEGREGVRDGRVAGVVEVDADGHAEALRALEELSNLLWHAHADRVGEDDLLGAGSHQPLGQSQHGARFHLALEGAAEAD